LFLPRSVFLFETLDPQIFEKPAKSPVQRACAQTHSTIAERFNVLDQRIPVARLVRKTQKNQEDRLREWSAISRIQLLSDMSHLVILYDI
jgi:hypothetical protein